MSAEAEEFRAKHKLDGYTLRYFNGQAHVTVSRDGVEGTAASSAGEAVAAKQALADLEAKLAEPEADEAVDTDEADDPSPSREESMDLHPASGEQPPVIDLPDLPPPPGF